MRVRFSGVTKRFGGHPVLRGVDLEIAAGECVVLLGPSGCGKTTLLRLLAGLERADSGEIAIGDRVVNEVDPAERDVAMVFQNYALYPHFTVFENIAFPLRARNVPPGEIEARVRNAASRVALDGLLERRPAQLSGGQQQRVALARAIVRNPAVYLMDEPLSNLDAQLRLLTRTELKRLHHELRTTMVYVTHDQAEAMTLAGRIAIMQHGRILQIGAPLDLYRRPANTFVATFLGNPAMNLVAAGAWGSGRSVPGAAQIGIRPEDVHLSETAAPGFEPATVVVLEPMGSESLVALDLRGARVIAKAGPDQRAEPGSMLWVRFAPERTHYFDGEGRRLQQPGEVGAEAAGLGQA